MFFKKILVYLQYINIINMKKYKFKSYDYTNIIDNISHDLYKNGIILSSRLEDNIFYIEFLKANEEIETISISLDEFIEMNEINFNPHETLSV